MPAGADLAQGPVHDAALRALGRIGTPAAVGLLLTALAQEGPVSLDAAKAPVRGPDRRHTDMAAHAPP